MEPSKNQSNDLKTQHTWRDGKPAKAVVDAIALFENLAHSMTKKVEKEIEKSKIKLTRDEMTRVLNKVQWAGNQHLPKKACETNNQESSGNQET